MTEPSPLRVFVDSGVVLKGCLSRWGAAKAVLILLAQRRAYTVVWAAIVEREISDSFDRHLETIRTNRDTTGLGGDPLASVAQERESEQARRDSARWLAIVRHERWPSPTSEDVQTYLPAVLPVLRHRNDLPVVVSAIQAQPDVVISDNRVHWNDSLARLTGLNIVSPNEFLNRLVYSTI